MRAEGKQASRAFAALFPQRRQFPLELHRVNLRVARLHLHSLLQPLHLRPRFLQKTYEVRKCFAKAHARHRRTVIRAVLRICITMSGEITKRRPTVAAAIAPHLVSARKHQLTNSQRRVVSHAAAHHGRPEACSASIACCRPAIAALLCSESDATSLLSGGRGEPAAMAPTRSDGPAAEAAKPRARGRTGERKKAAAGARPPRASRGEPHATPRHNAVEKSRSEAAQGGCGRPACGAGGRREDGRAARRHMSDESERAGAAAFQRGEVASDGRRCVTIETHSEKRTTFATKAPLSHSIRHAFWRIGARQLLKFPQCR